MFELLKRVTGVGANPLSHLSSAQRWLNQTKGLDAGDRIDQYLAMVKHVTEQGMPPNPEAIFALDEALQPALMVRRQHYVQNLRMPKAMEEKSWHEVTQFILAQLNLLNHLLQNEQFDVLSEAHKAKILVLFLHYVGSFAKWNYFRFQALPAEFWVLAHKTLRLAELSSIESLPAKLAGHAEEVSTCTDQYLRLLLLDTVSSSGLNLRQLDAVDEWVRIWCQGVNLDRQFTVGKHYYAIDTAVANGPIRIGDATTFPGTFRFVDGLQLLQQIDEARQLMRNGNATGRIRLPDVSRQPGALELVNLLYGTWSNVDVARKRDSERKDVSKLLDVGVGFDAVCALISSYNTEQLGSPDRAMADYDEQIDMRLYGFVSQRTKAKHAAAQQQVAADARQQAHFDNWVVQNESAGGFGVQLSAERISADIQLGGLLAVRVNDQENWHIAVLRRVQQQENRHFYVGIQVLGLDPLVAYYHENDVHAVPHAVGGNVMSVGVRVPRPAIYVELNTKQTKMKTLILPAAAYTSGKPMSLKLGDGTLSVVLMGVLEQGTNWVWVDTRPS